jgi:predicted nucleic acid-binding Zn ribbon protein
MSKKSNNARHSGQKKSIKNQRKRSNYNPNDVKSKNAKKNKENPIIWIGGAILICLLVVLLVWASSDHGNSNTEETTTQVETTVQDSSVDTTEESVEETEESVETTEVSTSVEATE